MTIEEPMIIPDEFNLISFHMVKDPMLGHEIRMLPPPKSIEFRPDGKQTTLVMTDESIRFNYPDGRPLIEAMKDGTILVRGEKAPTYNETIYKNFVEWMELVGVKLPK